MNLPSPPPAYNAMDQAQARALMAEADNANQKRGQDVVISGDSNDLGPRLVIESPNGTRYRVLVSNAGVLSTVAV